MVSLARSEPGIPVRPHELDRDPYLFNAANGTLSLQTGNLLPHRREDLLTKLSPVKLDEVASCPTWEFFLARIMGDKEPLIRYLQRAIGYSLSGDVSEQVFAFLYGVGANGKTTLINTVLSLAGDYGRQAPPELLLAKRGEAHPTERADLVGARFVSCSETEGGRRLAEVLVKSITGGDRQIARRMRENFFEFDATHHVWLSGNHKPTVKGTDLAIWRRIHLVPFNVTIPEEEQDKHLAERLREELPGILRWAVEGCLDWQAEGLAPPEEVTAATAQYRQEMDVLGDFLEERCILDEREATPAAKLYDEYQNWCERAGEKSAGTRGFGLALGERGFARKKSNGNIWWHGLRLASERRLYPAEKSR